MPSLYNPESTPVTVIKVSPGVTYRDPVTGEDIPVKPGDVLSPDLALQLGAEGSLVMQQAGKTLSFQGSGVVSVQQAAIGAVPSEPTKETRDEAAEADSTDITLPQLSQPSEKSDQVASPNNTGQMDLPVLVEPILREAPQLESAAVAEKLSETLDQSSGTVSSVSMTPRVERGQEPAEYPKEPVPPPVETTPVAPGIPVITGISPDTGVDGDFITSARQLVVLGTGLAGNTITLKDKGEPVPGSASVDPTGHWQLALNMSTEGEHQLTAFASNAEGVSSAGSKPVSMVLDTTPPVLEIEKEGLTTDSTSATLKGSAAPDLKFVLTVGGKQHNVTADDNGRWQQDLDGLPEGRHSVKGTARAIAGHEAGFEQELQVSLSPEKPVISAIETDTGADGTDFITYKNKYILIGQGKPGTTAKLHWQKVLEDNSLDSTIHVFDRDASVGSSGQWEFNLKEDSDHSRIQYTVKLLGTDGRESPLSDPQVVTVDRVLPEIQAAEMTSLTSNPEAVYKLTFNKEMAISGTPKVLLGEDGSKSADLKSTDDPHSFTFSYSAPAGETVPNKIKGFNSASGQLIDKAGNSPASTLPEAIPISGAPGSGPDNQLPVVDSAELTVDQSSTGTGLGLQPPKDAESDPLTIKITAVPTLGQVVLPDGKTAVTKDQT
ncbi:MAG: Ig-like domain-containing protein, partial [Endozoicomonas sp.]